MSDPQEQPPPSTRRGAEFPLWFRMLIVAALTGGLLYQLFIRGDVATSLMLGGIIGTALGLNEVYGSRRRSDNGDDRGGGR